MSLLIGEIDPQQGQLIRKLKREIKKEELATNVNSLEDLAQFYTNLPSGQLKKEVKKLLDEFTTQASSQNVDIPRTLKNFFTMRDQNAILTNIKLLDDMVDNGGVAE